MNALLIAFMGLAIVGLAVLIPLVGQVKYNQGFLAGLQEKPKQLPAVPSGPYQCPHLWEPWSKGKWAITPGGSPLSGWGRMQRRICGQCGEEEERIV